MPRTESIEKQKPARKPTAHRKIDVIARQLERRVQSGEFPIDSFLPTENELVKQYHCSRGTIGKALDRLKQRGLIQRNTRTGTRVVRHEPISTLPTLDAFAFVFPSQDHPPMWQALRGFQAEAEKVGRRVVMMSYGFDFNRECEILSRLSEFTIQAVALYPIVDRPDSAQSLAQVVRDASSPIVLVCLSTVEMERPTVVVNGFDAGFTVTRHLIDRGARQIALLGNNCRT